MSHMRVANTMDKNQIVGVANWAKRLTSRIIRPMIASGIIYFQLLSQVSAAVPYLSRPSFQRQTSLNVLATPGPYGLNLPGLIAPILYPDNAGVSLSRFISPMLLARKYHLGDVSSGLSIREVTFEKFSQVDIIRSAHFVPRTIGPNRMVYNVVTTFVTDQQAHGNHWSSGRKTFILDAQTGLVLFINTIGNRTVNAGVARRDSVLQTVGQPRGFRRALMQK